MGLVGSSNGESGGFKEALKKGKQIADDGFKEAIETAESLLSDDDD